MILLCFLAHSFGGGFVLLTVSIVHIIAFAAEGNGPRSNSSLNRPGVQCSCSISSKPAILGDDSESLVPVLVALVCLGSW